MKKLFYTILILFIIIYSGFSQSASDTLDKKIPTLNGHTFPTAAHFQNSFITTSLQADIGFGNTSALRIAGLQIGEHELFAFEGKLLFVSLNVKYKQRFNKWLALYFSFSMAGRLGTDMSMILADGVNTISGGEIGWLIRIMQSKKFNLSTNVYIQNMSGNFINVSKYFEDVINDVPNPRVMRKVPSMSVGLGVQGAYAFNQTFGLQFFTDFAYGESFERVGSEAYYSLGILGDVDFNPKQNVPIGLGLGYTLSSAPDIIMDDGGMANIISGKLGYTGSDEFELGLQYTYYKLKLKSVDQNPSISTILLVLKFYF
jgi:hypothetical protein